MLLPLALVILAADWSHVDDDNGLSLDSRPVEGSKYLEYRITTTIDRFPIEAACRAVYGDGKPSTSDVKMRKMMKDEPHERIYYDQVESSIVSTRDYAIRQAWRVEGDTCTVEFQTVNNLAPPIKDGWVRIEKMYGATRIVPKGDKAQLTYTIMTDVAGSIPAVFVEGARKKSTFDEARRAISRINAAGKKALAEPAAAPAPDAKPASP